MGAWAPSPSPPPCRRPKPPLPTSRYRRQRRRVPVMSGPASPCWCCSPGPVSRCSAERETDLRAPVAAPGQLGRAAALQRRGRRQPALVWPTQGPFDKRLGYYPPAANSLERLRERHFLITAQARQSPALLAYATHGFFPPFAEKQQAGLAIADCRGEPLYLFRYPQQLYPQLRRHPAAGGRQPAVHREPPPARLQPAAGQPGGGLAALRQGGAVAGGQDARHPGAVRRRQHPGHPAGEVPPLARTA